MDLSNVFSDMINGPYFPLFAAGGIAIFGLLLRYQLRSIRSRNRRKTL